MRFRFREWAPGRGGRLRLMVAIAAVLGTAAILAVRATAPPLVTDRLLDQPSAARAEALAREVARSCRPVKNHDERLNCRLDKLLPVARERVEVAMGALERLGRADREVDGQGHVYAHGIGMAAYAGEVGRTFVRCSELYRSGCYHGVIQGYFEALRGRRSGAAPEPAIFAISDVEGVCRPFRGASGDPLLLFHCTHGMGHGLTTFHGHDLPRALGDCDLLYHPAEREMCYGGAFMENIMNATEPHHSGAGLGARASGAGQDHGTHAPAAFQPLDPDDLLYPCSRQPRRYRTACYSLQTSAILHLNGRDFAGAARVCDGAPVLMRPWCYSSLGRDVSAEAGRDVAVELCMVGSPKYRPWCYSGAVKDIAYVRGSEEAGRDFCRRVEGGLNKAACYRGLGEQLMTLVPPVERRREICLSAEEDFRDDCLSGAHVPAVPGAPAAVERPRRGA